MIVVEKTTEGLVDPIATARPMRDDKKVLCTGEGDVEEAHHVEFGHAVEGFSFSVN